MHKCVRYDDNDDDDDVSVSVYLCGTVMHWIVARIHNKSNGLSRLGIRTYPHSYRNTNVLPILRYGPVKCW